ncbi:MAG: hypothetical protein J6X28_00595 [Bacilli bacterium]|nr:hypothetical protein [Bacilli bacterium]
MYLKLGNQKIKIQEADTFSKQFKSLKFYLYPLDFCIYFPRKRFLNTTFFCQKIDACFVDSDYKILYLHEGVKSERRIFHPKAKGFYILPLGTCKYLKVGDTLKLVQK